MPFHFQPQFDRALPYVPFLEKFGTAEHRTRWQGVYDKVALTPEQCALVGGFRRKMQVLCLSGPWCGDCVNACPIYQKIAEAGPQAIDLRFINRAQAFNPAAGDPDTLVANEISICGGPRVPVLVFLSEDGYECERYGERTLHTYRAKVASLQGDSCPTGLIPPPADLIAANTAEWLTHFERVQWMLLTSPRLRKLHHEM